MSDHRSISEYHEDHEETMRYGKDPDSCPSCRESLTRLCKFHREMATSRAFDPRTPSQIEVESYARRTAKR